MEASMSLKARRELLNSIRERYRQAAKSAKTKILGERHSNPILEVKLGVSLNAFD